MPSGKTHGRIPLKKTTPIVTAPKSEPLEHCLPSIQSQQFIISAVPVKNIFK
jgi:hypothetical protein